jgi:hypothetical protein
MTHELEQPQLDGISWREYDPIDWSSHAFLRGLLMAT